MTEPAPPAYAAQYCYRHPDREAGVRCVRCDRPICPACMIPAAVGFQCPECVRHGNRDVRRPVSRFGGRAGAGAPVTYSLIVVNVVVFVIVAASGGIGGLLSGQTTGNGQIYADFALIPPAVAHGEWWRLVSSAFLHFGILHIGFNMLALYFVGPPVEAALGRWRYLTLYMLSGIGGSLLTVAIAAPFTEAAGASGAIFGLFGAVYVLQRRLGQQSTILPIIVINLILSFTITNISWEGHIGGLIVGTLFTLALIGSAGRAEHRLQRHLAVTVASAVLLAGLGFAAVVRERHGCATTTNRDDAVFCLVYDPGSVPNQGLRVGVGNAAPPPGVVPSSDFTRPPGGQDA